MLVVLIQIKQRLSGFWLTVLLIWSGIITCFTLLLWIKSWSLSTAWMGGVLVFIVLGWLQYLLLQALHEAVHRFFGQDNLASLLAAILTTYPVGFTRDYRALHLAHHRYFGDAESDPDYASYGDFPKSRWQFLRLIAGHSVGISAIKQFFTQQKLNQQNAGKKNFWSKELGFLLATQLLLLILLNGQIAWWAYFVFWLAPLFVIVKPLSVLRVLCEHGDPMEIAVLRTFACSPWQRNILGAFGLGQHAEHHVKPTVLYEQLPALHQQLVKENCWHRRQDLKPLFRIYAHNHFHLLLQWFAALPWRSSSDRVSIKTRYEQRL